MKVKTYQTSNQPAPALTLRQQLFFEAAKLCTRMDSGRMSPTAYDKAYARVTAINKQLKEAS